MLTKSDFLLFLESPLHLWIKAHNYTEPKPTTHYDQHLADQGYEVEKLAKTLLERKVATEYPAGTTLNFEATLTDGHYQSRIDALVHDVIHNTYDLYEIKSATKVETDHKFDVTFQYLVAKASLPINKVYVVHPNSKYIKDGPINLTELFLIEDMMAVIEEKSADVLDLRNQAWNTLNLDTMPIDEHCYKRKVCPYPEICFANLPSSSIYDLMGGQAKLFKKLEAEGIKQLDQILANFDLNAKQRLLVKSVQAQQPIIDAPTIREQLDKLEFPLYFLDYETYQPAVPMFDGYKPYQHIVTQFSLHIVKDKSGQIFEHHEFIAEDAGDPSFAAAQALCNLIGGTGNVISWNKSFECGKNSELGEFHPQYAEQLKSINARTFDLMEIFSKGLYIDYRCHGSASIKKVLPVLVPELSYAGLPVADGTTAMMKWKEMVFEAGLSDTERAEIKQNLLKYCELDTWAMVEIWRRLFCLPE